MHGQFKETYHAKPEGTWFQFREKANIHKQAPDNDVHSISLPEGRRL